MLSRLPGQPEGGGGPTASVELGSSSSSRRATSSQIDGGRAVRFDSVVKMILVPCRLDLSDGLSDELWWNGEDYLQFRCGTILGVLSVRLLPYSVCINMKDLCFRSILCPRKVSWVVSFGNGGS